FRTAPVGALCARRAAGFSLSYRTAISRFFVSPYAKKRRLYHYVPALQGVFIKDEPLRVSTITNLPLSACIYYAQFGKANELKKSGGMTSDRLYRKKLKVTSRLSNLRSRSAENRKTERRIRTWKTKARHSDTTI